jgi:hypothetical protein
VASPRGSPATFPLLLLLKTSLMSTAYRELYARSDGGLKGLHVEILRELDLRELARDESVRVRAMAFAELCDVLRVSPGHMSALLSKLESLGPSRPSAPAAGTGSRSGSRRTAPRPYTTTTSA